MKPQNYWVAEVWEDLLRTKRSATEQELIQQYGSISGVPSMSSIVDRAVRSGWFRRVGGDRLEAAIPLKQEKAPQVPWQYVERLGQVSSVFALGAR